MIILAHDGSLYGDWISCYAVNFAVAEEDRKLLALHVLDDTVSAEVVSAKFAQLSTLCQERKIDFSFQLLPLGKGVYRSLRQAIPHNANNLLIFGTRSKVKKRTLLRGSIAEKLLRTHQCPVLAIRVVQPGLLGSPEELLLPLAGHWSGVARIEPIVKRLIPSAHRLHLFRALQVNHLRHAHLSITRERRLLIAGQNYLEDISTQLTAILPQKFSLESQVMIATGWQNAVLTQASRLKAQMILLGVSERSLAHKMFYGAGVEQVLRDTPCDIGIYRAP
ncbi:Nucleotide-binding universal stress protein, UspA family [Malonomonas rubra DSM 5091]|uniref:Nucleotide-binding universal stress protein, UspA family n=1 Tax=Malonomonas rubra DSM 5091 TaxID=1122189 RepID=A0A1M6NFR8_MALRU|nr:universal stress protein [Malonomonas rubra]SHJ94575.1 Nucleotide-binding universal stress protein, UspA family [Malonomonas rubra DSM 5091]